LLACQRGGSRLRHLDVLFDGAGARSYGTDDVPVMRNGNAATENDDLPELLT
jgi:hypothetical protein